MLPTGLGLAHTGRLIMLAKELRMCGFKVYFGAGSDAAGVLEHENIDYIPIREFSKSVYEKKLKRNNLFVYSRRIIEDFVRDELSLYHKIKPDLVVYDFRYTARISAEIAGIKTVSITNANMTPYYDFSKVKFPLNTLFFKFLPDRILHLINREYGQQFLKQISPMLFQSILIVEMIRMSPSLLKLGYKIRKDPYQLLLGDLTLVTDIAEFRPVKPMPSNIKMIGPIFWDGGNKIPKWGKKLAARSNIVYITAGGTGDKKIFRKIIGYFKNSEYTVVATTGNTMKPEALKITYKNLFVTDYLPGDFILPKAKIIIFPGGNATCYQALSFGVPQILTPLHIDQEDNANQLERLGCGVVIDPYKELDKRNFLAKVDQIIKNKIYKLNSMAVMGRLKRFHGPQKAAFLIDKLIS